MGGGELGLDPHVVGFPQRPRKQQHLVIVTSTFPVVSETFIVDHVKAMLASGWLVSVVAGKIDHDALDIALPKRSSSLHLYALPGFINVGAKRILKRLWHVARSINSHAHPCSLHARLMAVRALRLREVLAKLEPDLVHAHFGPNGVISALALKGANVPLIVNFHGYDVTEFPERYGWKMYSSMLSEATLVAHSQFVQNQIRDNLGLNSVRVTMGVDLNRFSRTRSRGEHWPKPLQLLSIGRLLPIKGHDVAVDVLAAVRRASGRFGAHLQIIGDGVEKKALQEKIKMLQLDHLVSGPQTVNYSDMPELIRSADVLLVCSQPSKLGWQEAFCRVAIEAMACGLAVVVTPSGGLPDTVSGAGYVATGFDSAAITSALLSLLENESPMSCERKSINVAKKYSLEKMVYDYNEISNYAVGGKKMISFVVSYYQYFSGRWRKAIIKLLDLPMNKRKYRMYISHNDKIGSEIQGGGYYEAEILKAIEEIASYHKLNFGTALDVGANIGNHSLYFSGLFRKVLSFEPSPVLNLVLQANILRNEIDNVQVFGCGLGNKSGLAVVQELSENHTGMVQLNTGPDVSLTDQSDGVEIFRGDDVLKRDANGKGIISFIKIDVEGMELQVLEGLSDTISRDQPLIAFESRSYQEGIQVMSYLRGLGYQYFYELQSSRLPPRAFSQISDAILGRKRYSVKPLNSLSDRHYSAVFAWVNEI